MASDYNCSGPSNGPDPVLGLFLCLLVLAYIYHCLHIAPRNLAASAQEQSTDPDDGSLATPSQENLQHLINVPPLIPISPVPEDAVLRTPYDRGYYDGMKAYVQFDLADIHRAKQLIENSKSAVNKTVEKNEVSFAKRERNLEREIMAFEKECREVRREMKTWREEYLKAIWEVKQKGEKGLLAGWLGFGGPRASAVVVKEEKSPVVKAPSGISNDDPEVRYKDEKKG